MSNKNTLRTILIQKRRAIPLMRRKQAAEKAYEKLSCFLSCFSPILSFASQAEELDLWPLNVKLAREGRLALPYTEASRKLTLYRVNDIDKQLKIHSKWQVREPIPALCQVLKLDQISSVLVPGVGFDHHHHRLGYGKGYYDSLLSHLNCPCFGVGFREQLLEELIPFEAHDVPLSDVFLF